MNYNVKLNDEQGKALEVETIEDGRYIFGWYMSGTELNIPYNYADVYNLFNFNIQELNGKIAKDTLLVLEQITDKLPNQHYKKDQNAPTPGNARNALAILLKWAKQHPEGIWNIC